MLMLMMLSLIGIAATTTSTIEMGIAANERAYKDNLNRAERIILTGQRPLPSSEYRWWKTRRTMPH